MTLKCKNKAKYPNDCCDSPLARNFIDHSLVETSTKKLRNISLFIEYLGIYQKDNRSEHVEIRPSSKQLRILQYLTLGL